MSGEDPLVQYESGGQASVINYNIPLPTSYGCRSIVELDFPSSYFRSHADEKPGSTIRDDLADRPIEDIRDRVAQAMREGFYDPILFEHIDIGQESPVQPGGPQPVDPAPWGGDGARGGAIDRSEMSDTVREIVESPAAMDALAEHIRLRDLQNVRTDGGAAAAAAGAIEQESLGEFDYDDYLSVKNYFRPVASLTPEQVARRVKDGQFMYLRSTLHGDVVPGFAPEPVEPEPQFAIVERYRISNFLGNYGAGRTLKTFSLFPGEETTITLKTYRNEKRSRQEAASIFESSSREAAYEFERELQTETTSSVKETKKRNWKAGGKAELNLGIFKVGGGGGGGGSSTAVREHTARSVASASSRHAAKASAKREVEVNSEAKESVETGEERLIERKIENINVSRTLNLVFRQLNQQYLTLFHLTDVRIAFSNGFPGSYREAPLYELDQLVDDVVTDDDQAAVKQGILEELSRIYDYRGEAHDDFVEQVERGDHSYWRVNEDLETTFEDEATGLSKTVPGVVLSGTVNAIRTDGVIVEALLGRGEALDDYSQALQSEAVRARDLNNDLLATEIDRAELGMELVENDDNEGAAVYHKVFAEEEEDEDEAEAEPIERRTDDD
ncbi:hypothetical protein [Haloarchaeobius amylolyticus]|uniref:hypothetical protein n=1 Tax=Haloarchaeobius amylolyticus TaxID=1198296 RepID=UPI002271D187|nr:hypothetical protein [Haloarchaeobius amylolyticus]